MEKSFSQLIADFDAKRQARVTPAIWKKSQDYVRESCLTFVIEKTTLKEFDRVDRELEAYGYMCQNFEKDFNMRKSLILTTQAILENNGVITDAEINEHTNDMLDLYANMTDTSWKTGQ